MFLKVLSVFKIMNKLPGKWNGKKFSISNHFHMWNFLHQLLRQCQAQSWWINTCWVIRNKLSGGGDSTGASRETWSCPWKPVALWICFSLRSKEVVCGHIWCLYLMWRVLGHKKWSICNTDSVHLEGSWPACLVCDTDFLGPSARGQAWLKNSS